MRIAATRELKLNGESEPPTLQEVLDFAGKRMPLRKKPTPHVNTGRCNSTYEGAQQTDDLADDLSGRSRSKELMPRCRLRRKRRCARVVDTSCQKIHGPRLLRLQTRTQPLPSAKKRYCYKQDQGNSWDQWDSSSTASALEVRNAHRE